MSCDMWRVCWICRRWKIGSWRDSREFPLFSFTLTDSHDMGVMWIIASRNWCISQSVSQLFHLFSFTLNDWHGNLAVCYCYVQHVLWINASHNWPSDSLIHVNLLLCVSVWCFDVLYNYITQSLAECYVKHVDMWISASHNCVCVWIIVAITVYDTRLRGCLTPVFVCSTICWCMTQHVGQFFPLFTQHRHRHHRHHHHHQWTCTPLWNVYCMLISIVVVFNIVCFVIRATAAECIDSSYLRQAPHRQLFHFYVTFLWIFYSYYSPSVILCHLVGVLLCVHALSRCFNLIALNAS